MRNAPAEPVLVHHRCVVHGQCLIAPETFTATCGKCGRVCVPDENPA